MKKRLSSRKKGYYVLLSFCVDLQFELDREIRHKTVFFFISVGVVSLLK